jgi:hypothetical protein
MTTEALIDPTKEGTLSGMDIPVEVLALAAEDPSAAIGSILAGQVGDNAVDSGDLQAPSLDQLASSAEGVFGGAAKIKIGEGQRFPWITLWRSLDGLPRRCMLVYTDSSGKNHDFGMKYLKKRHTAESAPEHPDFWGKPIFLPRPPEGAPMHPALAASCPRCGKKMNDEFEVDRHMKKKHPSDHERLESMRTRTEATSFQTAITDQNQQIVKLISAIVSPGTKVGAADKAGDAAPVGGVFHYARDAAVFYEISKDHLLNQVREGKMAGAKDPKGVWMVWVPDADWSPPEK